MQRPGASFSTVPELLSSPRMHAVSFAGNHGQGDSGFLSALDHAMRIRSSDDTIAGKRPYIDSLSSRTDPGNERAGEYSSSQDRSDRIVAGSKVDESAEMNEHEARRRRDQNRADAVSASTRGDDAKADRPAETKSEADASISARADRSEDTTDSDEAPASKAELAARLAHGDAGKSETRRHGKHAGHDSLDEGRKVSTGGKSALRSEQSVEVATNGTDGDAPTRDAANKAVRAAGAGTGGHGVEASDRPALVNAVRADDKAESQDNRFSQQVSASRSRTESVVSPDSGKGGSSNEKRDRSREGDDGRSRETGASNRRVRVEVRDLRPAAERAASQGEQREVKIETENGGFSRRLDGPDAANRSGSPDRTEGSLARTVREQTQPEILRQARLVVRGESSGDIRMVLKPEHLGRIRISLHLEDNRIAGRIIVENSSVRDAFQENVQALERALRESGIETAGLEVSVGEGGDDSGADDRQSGLRRRVAAGFDELVPTVIGWYDDIGTVNVYV